jgi:hypothetical protein
VCVCVWPSPSHSGRFLLKGLDFDVSDRYTVIYRVFSVLYLLTPSPPFLQQVFLLVGLYLLELHVTITL